MNRPEIFKLAKELYNSEHTEKFVPGVTKITSGGRCVDYKEMLNLVDSALNLWLTGGQYEKRFIDELSKFIDSAYLLSTNSGTSANLLAMSALQSPYLAEPIKKGDEIITVAAGFPTTVAPIVQTGLIPVFVDVKLGNYNIDAELLKKAISKKTQGIFIAHTMGNPFDIATIDEICEDHRLYLLEDNCDALGAKYDGQYTGTVGDLSTFSFYPAHHITTGEGGAVSARTENLRDIVKSLRDWGRDCRCETGEDNSCGMRFNQKFGQLPYGYDHKYVFSHLGYNMKMTDMQGAVGLAQVQKLPEFIEKRMHNFYRLYMIFEEYDKYFILPEINKVAEPSPFGFVLTVKDGSPFTRLDIVNYLEKHQIQTRMLFAGNIVRQPCMTNVKYRVSGNLKNSDKIMNDTFWIGVHPGITDEMIDYVQKTMKTFWREYVLK